MDPHRAEPGGADGSIRRVELPAGALLGTYLSNGGYADCYVTGIGRPVSQAEFVEAFYTTALFKLERLVLAWVVHRPSTDAEAAELGAGTRTTFAAWEVEATATDQLLLRDLHGRTRSWLMTAPGADTGTTRLYFGSAVVPSLDRRTGRKAMGAPFRLLLGFHKLYSRALLRAAAARLKG